MEISNLYNCVGREVSLCRTRIREEHFGKNTKRKGPAKLAMGCARCCSIARTLNVLTWHDVDFANQEDCIQREKREDACKTQNQCVPDCTQILVRTLGPSSWKTSELLANRQRSLHAPAAMPATARAPVGKKWAEMSDS